MLAVIFGCRLSSKVFEIPYVMHCALHSGICGRRRARNSRYSLRAFARDLGVSRSVLSSALLERTALSQKNRRRLVSMFGSESKVSELPSERFHLFDRWYYLPILNLCHLVSHRTTPLWVAKELGIQVGQAKEAIAMLVSNGYLRIEKGRFLRCVPPFDTRNDVSAAQIQRYHQSILSLAAQAITREPVERREYQTMCLALSNEYYPTGQPLRFSVGQLTELPVGINRIPVGGVDDCTRGANLAQFYEDGLLEKGPVSGEFKFRVQNRFLNHHGSYCMEFFGNGSVRSSCVMIESPTPLITSTGKIETLAEGEWTLVFTSKEELLYLQRGCVLSPLCVIG